ncbi:MAG TPA: dihydrodipicolinate synthase family protein [Balneolaceae bacterium]|nr:dihydrodipicolinate synthase family protein [Balneolaceae bacterium]
MQVNWKGIYPAITTKFHQDGTIDFEAFNNNIEKQVEAGIHGVVIGGSLGEASTLGKKEKLLLLESTLQTVDGKIPVIVNIAESSTQEAIQTAQEAEKNDADGLMMLPPMMYKADNQETVRFFKSVASATNLPIMLYNNPVDYGIKITLDMLGDLAEHDNIQAVKESTRDLTNITRMINRFGDRYSILCGVDTLALEALVMGADGWVAGLVCAFPRETVAIYELVQDGRLEEARNIFRWFLPLLELDIDPKLVQNIKLAEVATGLGTEYVRPPRLPLTGKEREKVQTIIDEALANRPDLAAYSI